MKTFHDITWESISVWPDALRPQHERIGSRFDSSISSSIYTLRSELRHIDATRPVVHLALPPGSFRKDGQPRSGMRQPDHPGVILFTDSKHGDLRYSTDVFRTWEDNLRAIALSLESLRRVDRYGVTEHGEQYQGWKALGAGATALGSMSVEDAAEFLIEWGEWGGDRGDPEVLIEDPAVADRYYRSAARRLHPDTTTIVSEGDALFHRLQAAKAVLDRRH